MRSLLLLAALLPLVAHAQVEIDAPWSRATAPGARIGVGYMTIRNKAGSADRLVSASSPVAARVETHVTVKEGDIFRMREVKGYEIPASGAFELKPAGAHLMLVDLKQPLKEGDHVPLTLRFAKAGEVKTELVVQKGASAPMHSH
jgi:copper(I)-binding protein